jgi:hypothetical protein
MLKNLRYALICSISTLVVDEPWEAAGGAQNHGIYHVSLNGKPHERLGKSYGTRSCEGKVAIVPETS